MGVLEMPPVKIVRKQQTGPKLKKPALLPLATVAEDGTSVYTYRVVPLASSPS